MPNRNRWGSRNPPVHVYKPNRLHSKHVLTQLLSSLRVLCGAGTYLTSRSLLELSLDGNPVAGQNGLGSSYRRYVLHHLPSLRHLDLKRVTDHDQPFSKQQQQQREQQRERGQQSSATRTRGVRGKGFAEERSAAGSAANPSSGRPSTTDGVMSISSSNHTAGDDLPVLPSHHHHHHHQHRASAVAASAASAAPGDTPGGARSQAADAIRRIHHSRSGGGAGAPSPPPGTRDSTGRGSGGAWEQVNKWKMKSMVNDSVGKRRS